MSGAKELKSGKISIQLDTPILNVLIQAVECRQIFDQLELENYYYFLLEEALEKLKVCRRLGGGKVALRKSEYFAILTDGITQYLDDPTKILLRDLVTPARRIT